MSIEYGVGEALPSLATGGDVRNDRDVRRIEVRLERFEESLGRILELDGLCVDCVTYVPETNGKPLEFVVGRDRYGLQQKFQPDAVITYMQNVERYKRGFRRAAAAWGAADAEAISVKVRKLYKLWERTSLAFKIDHRMLGLLITGFVEEKNVGEQLAHLVFDENDADDASDDDAGYRTP